LIVPTFIFFMNFMVKIMSTVWFRGWKPRPRLCMAVSVASDREWRVTVKESHGRGGNRPSRGMAGMLRAPCSARADETLKTVPFWSGGMLKLSRQAGDSQIDFSPRFLILPSEHPCFDFHDNRAMHNHSLSVASNPAVRHLDSKTPGRKNPTGRPPSS